ncbi:MAG: hypothetical protein ABSC55_14755 [Syntrophorhabdales bacterium]|jgi:hypothetical protein
MVIQNGAKDESFSSKLLMILDTWRRYQQLLTELNELAPSENPIVGNPLKAFRAKIGLDFVLRVGTRDPRRLEEAITRLTAKYGDNQSIQIIHAVSDRFPLEALARFLVAWTNLKPADIKALLDLSKLLRRATIDRFAPWPKIAFSVLLGAIFLLLNKMPQSVVEIVGLNYDQYQLWVVIGGLFLLVYVGVFALVFWTFFHHLRTEFRYIDQLLRMMGLVSGVTFEEEPQAGGSAAKNKDILETSET